MVGVVFTGGNKLKTRVKELKGIRGAVKVGNPIGSGGQYPDGTLVAEVAAYLEFGTRDHPGWHFYEIGAKNYIRDNVDERIKLAKKVVNHQISAKGALELIGLAVVSKKKEAITDIVNPPNTIDTIARKGSSNPGIDKGQFRQSVTHEVE